MLKTCCFSTSIFWGSGLDFGASWASKSAALLAAPGVLKPTAFMLALTDCFSFLRGGQSGPNSRVNLAVVSTSWLIFHYWPVFDLPWVCLSAFWSFFSRLGTLQPRFWSPSWPYVGTYFALGGIFGHGAGIAAKRTAGIHFLLFVSTMQRGGTCAAHGIGAKLVHFGPKHFLCQAFFTLLN